MAVLPRVLHVPNRTPYVRKLHSPLCEVVNGTPSLGGSQVPNDANLKWLRSQQSFSFFDIVHIHFFEGESLDDISAALNRCLEERKAIVVTVHDLSPVFSSDAASFDRKLAELCTKANAVITLTQQAVTSLLERGYLNSEKVTIAPHGYVVPPKSCISEQILSQNGVVEYVIFGSFRRNRASYCTLVDWFFALRGLPVRMNILLRPLGPFDPPSERTEMEKILAFMEGKGNRIRASMLADPSDEALVSFLAGADVLVMPYISGTHSGQLELAFDLNLVPVITNVGFYSEQWARCAAHIQEPVWVNWSDGATHLYGGRLIEALTSAYDRATGNVRSLHGAGFREHRLAEHAAVLDAHRQVYAAAVAAAEGH